MGKVVEFFGIPGCGKSTLTNSVCEEFIRRDYKVCSDDIIFNKEKKACYFAGCSFTRRCISIFSMQSF